MSDSAARPTVELTFLALAGIEYELGVPAERVREVVPAGAWSGEPAVDVADLVPALALADGAERVLAIALAGGGVLPLRTRSVIAVRTVAAAALVRLPRVVTRDARWIRGIVFADAGLPLVVIDADAVADRADVANRPADQAPALTHQSLEELW